MSDTAARGPVAAPQMLADALLRSVAGTTALLRMTGANTASSMHQELGLVATTFLDAVISPVVIRRLKPGWKQDEAPQWELLVSATSVEQQVNTLQLDSARALFSTTLKVTVGEQDYFIESIAANEAFGQVYLYRLLLREARPQGL